MRPYLAVLKDSFREALSSRVLWILLIGITVVLVLMSPLGFKEIRSSKLRRVSVRDWPILMAKIEDQAQRDGPSPARQVRERLRPEFLQKLAAAAEQSPGEYTSEIVEQVVGEINRVIDGPSLYSAAAWENVSLGKEARELIDSGAADRGGAETSRLNRLLIEAAWPSEFQKGRKAASETALVYLWMEGDPHPLTREQSEQGVKYYLQWFVYFGLGVFGVFASILVTSSIVPQMFEPGAIDLLLSKPVSRVQLFLTKFAGGCIFIGLIATYFLGGVWLVVGLRFGVWTPGLFLAVPVYLFLFAVYYSVSALAGVLWRNAIISVILAVLFWGFCLGLWLAKVQYFEQYKIAPERFVKIVPAGTSLLAVNELGQSFEWSRRFGEWQETFVSDEPPAKFGSFFLPRQLYGQVYDERGDRILAGVQGLALINPLAPAPPLLEGKRATAWTRKKLNPLPLGVLSLMTDSRGEILALSKGAVFKLAPAKPGRGKKEEPAEKFVRLGPEPSLRLDSSASAAINPDTGAIAILNRGSVTLLEQDSDGKYNRKAEKEFAGEKEMGVVAFGGNRVAVALSDGRIRMFDSADLSSQGEYRPFGDNAPRFAASAPGGRWISVLFHNRKLWMFDVQNNRPAGLSFVGQGDISAATFGGANRLLTADRATRVTQVDLDPYRVGETQAPELSKEQTIYYYGLMPLYGVLPKPGELNGVIDYFLSEKSSIQAGANPQDMSDRREEVEISGPIWSSLGFVVLMLSLASLYVWRTDF
ncbi:MAG: ABC transporter permease [Planctomycetia bacterium]|nr:ABC transporter permease [Planctomycetia bacterium]